jgi:uncharacterized protein YecT (DUF1311 family)
MARIAISYRRSDSQDITGRIFDRLVMHYGKSTVFRDIDSIRPGIDFRTQIADALKATDVLLVIVGPHWLGRGEGAASRMDNEADPVRIEVETALKRDIPIVPVLVRGVKMPEVGELPGSLRDFAFRHAVNVDGGRDFDHHIEGLIRSLDQFFGTRSGDSEGMVSAERRKPSFLKKYGLAGGLAAVVVVLAAILFRTDTKQPAVAVQPQPYQPQPNQPVAVVPQALPTPSPPPTVAPPVQSPDSQYRIAPKFDCASSSGQDEQTICQNGELTVLDRELNAVYTAVRGRLDKDKQKALAADENFWLGQRAVCKTDVVCIRAAYQKRLKVLQAWP